VVALLCLADEDDDGNKASSVSHTPAPTRTVQNDAQEVFHSGEVKLTVTAVSSGTAASTGKPWTAYQTTEGKYFDNGNLNLEQGKDYRVTIEGKGITSAEEI
jgi:hypothetical protein